MGEEVIIKDAKCKTCVKFKDPYCTADPVWSHIADPDYHWCCSGAWYSLEGNSSMKDSSGNVVGMASSYGIKTWMELNRD